MMRSRWRLSSWLLPLLLVVLAAAAGAGCGRERAAAPLSRIDGRYAPASSCAGCHGEIAAAFARTGMGRSFSAFDPARTAADFRRNNRFYHAASERHYTMRLSSDGKSAFMRRHQVGFGGREENVVDKQIDFVLGSGHSAQSFLHRTERGELVQLPVAWYTENGGYWAMNPSYDRPDHPDFRRRIGYDCFFCHNAYPDLTSAASSSGGGGQRDSVYADPIYFPSKLPQGIDCQRCHGPGAAHVESSGKQAILNPKRLSPDASLEICMQCHLQSTSSALPHAIVKFGRGVFSFRAGAEPLGDYTQHFDHAAGSGREEKFEIAHAAYRLRMSACFVRSGRLTCTTCHNPHEVKRGAEAAADASRACRSCHNAPSAAAHPAAGATTAGATTAECVSCHMPKRRTEDVVHAVMTDHRITSRPPPGHLTAPRPERAPPPYQGRVEAYYPRKTDALHLAVGQVRAGSNLTEGVAMLEAAVAAEPDRCGADCYFELAEAYGRVGRDADALKAGERALELDPAHQRAQAAVGAQLSAMGNLERGAEILAKAGRRNPRALHDLALNYMKQGRSGASEAAMAAIVAEPELLPEFHSTLASIRYAGKDFAGAERAFREAVRLRPDYALARANLAVLLINRGAFGEAEFQFQAALRAEPGNQTVRALYDRARGKPLR